MRNQPLSPPVYLNTHAHFVTRPAKNMDGQVSRERLEQLLPAAYDNYQLLLPALDLMVHNRIETLRHLNQIAYKRHRLGNVAKVAGATTGILGSVAAATGVALTPMTLGFGLVLTAGGGRQLPASQHWELT